MDMAGLSVTDGGGDQRGFDLVLALVNAFWELVIFLDGFGHCGFDCSLLAGELCLGWHG